MATPEYRECLRDQSKEKLPQREIRYRDELFRTSVQECFKHIVAADSTEDAAVVELRNAALLVETLAILNAVPKPAAEQAEAPVLLTQPAISAGQPLEDLDPLMNEDFSVLYWPWFRCLAAVMSTDSEAQADEAIARAHGKCDEVSTLADSEAVRLLGLDGRYGEQQHHLTVLDDFRRTLSQLVVLSVLRSRGESLGAALEESEQATQ